MFSDGVTESSSPAGEEFGEDRLTALLADLRGEPAGSVVDRVRHALVDWTEGAPPTDDITAVAVRRC